MSGLNINPIDTSRDQYFDYGDYISRRHGDRYYNLGYAIYKGLILSPNEIGYIAPSQPLIEEAFTNFTVALLFKKQDEDAKKKRDNLCEFFGPNGSIQANLIQQSNINNWISNARATFRNCKCL
tara:strand:- start:629 stop:1000 length:372 start_codon:yes stop_codon:yes gene_type:complete